jgi:hypothetical protein
MGVQEHEDRSLEEIDAARRLQLEQVEDVVLQLLGDQGPATISELGDQVRLQLGDVENSVIRAALLRLLNGNRLPFGAPATQ